MASKSVRCRALLDRVLAREGYAGVLAFTLTEALWLAEEHEDVVVGYPTAERDALRELAADPVLLERVTLMVDSVESLDLVRSVVREVEVPIRYTGFELPDRYAVGYGLDLAQRYRNLPYVAALTDAAIAAASK